MHNGVTLFVRVRAQLAATGQIQRCGQEAMALPSVIEPKEAIEATSRHRDVSSNKFQASRGELLQLH
eukprot:m.267354 g.267354  ORF g.267354 m.267354 type:complete len:67 (+) comp15635_c0_seq4:3104-3304(+)